MLKLNLDCQILGIRYVKGTGVVDGNQQSSPGLVPSFSASKQPGAPGNGEPGATGGRWFVDTIGDPGVAELEQVNTPAEGLQPTESDFFGIAQVQTTGYSDVSGLIEFIVTGDTICKVGLKKAKIYDTPLHFHELVTGEPDQAAVKGMVNWGQEGGYRTAVKSNENDPTDDEAGYNRVVTKQFNLWGYMYADPNPIILKLIYQNLRGVHLIALDGGVVMRITMNPKMMLLDTRV